MKKAKRVKKTVEKVLAEMGARIRAEREARGWTQIDLAERVGLSQQWVSKVEQSGTREQENIVKLSKVLERSPAYLQYGIEELANMSEDAISMALRFDKMTERDRKIAQEFFKSLEKQPDK